jgi:hypothetical protein
MGDSENARPLGRYDRRSCREIPMPPVMGLRSEVNTLIRQGLSIISRDKLGKVRHVNGRNTPVSKAGRPPLRHHASRRITEPSVPKPIILPS